MNRTAIALIPTAASIAAVAVFANAGLAQGPAPTTLNLVGKSQKTVGFFPHHKPRQGDRFGFGDRITGDDTGYDRGVCTIIGKNQGLCTVVAKLSKGSLVVHGIVGLQGRANNLPFAITGGTGAYNGARGTALVTDVNSTTTNIQITLLP